MLRSRTTTFALVAIASFTSSCSVPVHSYSLAAPQHVGAAAPDPVLRPSKRAAFAKAAPTAPARILHAEDCKRVTKANGPLPASWREGASFDLRIGEDASSLRLLSTAVLPGASLPIEVLERRHTASFVADAAGGSLQQVRPGRWTWKAPREPGVYSLRVENRYDGESVCINAFVMRPYDGRGTINGYRVGGYPRQPLNGDPAYIAPRGFIEVRGDMRDMWVSPHFRLDQFLCKQATAKVEYLALSPRLLLKLEYLLARAHDRGIRASTFQILSAFRTPWYNARIGNDTRYSRHAYGDAADIFIDEDGDGRMDDLNGDGRITARDADVLYELVEDSMDDEAYQPLQGGLGLYAHAHKAGAFVHVDSRGTPIRWGTRIPQRSTPARMTERASARSSRSF